MPALTPGARNCANAATNSPKTLYACIMASLKVNACYQNEIILYYICPHRRRGMIVCALAPDYSL